MRYIDAERLLAEIKNIQQSLENRDTYLNQVKKIRTECMIEFCKCIFDEITSLQEECPVDMKANEAPEKIYIQRRNSYNNILGYDSEWTPIPLISEDNIEYTRIDAFIEKACEWIKTNMDDYIHVVYDTVTGMPTNEAYIADKIVVEDFSKYMKGE